MKKKILIHLPEYRSAADNNLSPPEAVLAPADGISGLKTVRELAVFLFTCRKCSDAPCIAACPAKALEKNTEGVIVRAINLCVSCKSCVVICPFGTLMTDFFRFIRDRDDLYDLTDEAELEAFIRQSPRGTVEITGTEENPEHRIYRLNDQVLVREYAWETE